MNNSQMSSRELGEMIKYLSNYLFSNIYKGAFHCLSSNFDKIFNSAEFGVVELFFYYQLFIL